MPTQQKDIQNITQSLIKTIKEIEIEINDLKIKIPEYKKNYIQAINTKLACLDSSVNHITPFNILLSNINANLIDLSRDRRLSFSITRFQNELVDLVDSIDFFISDRYSSSNRRFINTDSAERNKVLDIIQNNAKKKIGKFHSSLRDLKSKLGLGPSTKNSSNGKIEMVDLTPERNSLDPQKRDLKKFIDEAIAFLEKNGGFESLINEFCDAARSLNDSKIKFRAASKNLLEKEKLMEKLKLELNCNSVNIGNNSRKFKQITTIFSIILIVSFMAYLECDSQVLKHLSSRFSNRRTQ